MIDLKKGIFNLTWMFSGGSIVKVQRLYKKRNRIATRYAMSFYMKTLQQTLSAHAEQLLTAVPQYTSVPQELVWYNNCHSLSMHK